MTSRSGFSRHFLTYVSIFAALVVFAGFFRTYYLKAALGTPELPMLLHVHGIIMTLWFTLFIVQVRLVAMRRTDLHRVVGVSGAFLAALVVVVGTAVAIAAARRGFTPPNGPPPLMFLAIPLVDLLVFGTLVTTALLLRRRSDYHRRLMPIAALSLLTPAISRIPLDFIQNGGLPVFLGLTDLFVLGCVAFDTVRNRRLHPAYGWAAGLFIASQPLRFLMAGSSTWMQFATWLVK